MQKIKHQALMKHAFVRGSVGRSMQFFIREKKSKLIALPLHQTPGMVLTKLLFVDLHRYHARGFLGRLKRVKSAPYLGKQECYV